jgi:hypothetical protein
LSLLTANGQRSSTRAQSFQIESSGALTFWWSKIFSENRFPPENQVRGQAFSRIMLKR